MKFKPILSLQRTKKCLLQQVVGLESVDREPARDTMNRVELFE